MDLLHRHAITAVCDVRSQPYSRRSPQFNREPLKQALLTREVQYVFLGNELGARSDDPNCYRDGQVQYELLAQTDKFKAGIARVKHGAQRYRVALMCAEREPLECHRSILISRKLDEDGISVRHILPDGRLEDHRESVQRLINSLHIHSHDMFRGGTDVVGEAYSRREHEIAYRTQAGDGPKARHNK